MRPIRLHPRAIRSGLALAVAVLFGACGQKSPASPSREAPSPQGGLTVTGLLVDGTSSLPVSGADVTIDGIGDAHSGADGSFVMRTDAAAGLRAVTVTGPQIVDRAAWVTAPGTAITLPLMPASLNLDAFDQMFRGNGGVLHRWTTAPHLVVQARVLQFTNITDTTYTGTAAAMSDGETAALAADLTWALPQLTGDTFGAFADLRFETAAATDAVAVQRPATIVVARYDGLTAATGYAGYTRWQWSSAGDVTMGVLMLDDGYDASPSVYRRAVRTHELGHALGYNHVSTTASVMNPIVSTEPTAFDLGGARIAFQRPLFNRHPDADPQPGTTTSGATGAGEWHGAP